MTTAEHFTRLASVNAVAASLAYTCLDCGECWSTAEDAEECCGCSDHGHGMLCPICLRPADSFELAADCCLHTHPTMTAAGRELVAQAVASGTPWADAIAAHANH